MTLYSAPFLSFLSLLATNITVTTATNLNVTALTHRGPISILQCWSLEPPFSTSASGPVGASVASLGAVSGNASFIVQPPGSIGGYKNAPVPQYVYVNVSVSISLHILHLASPCPPH